MKESMKDYNYPQGNKPSAKVEGGIDDKKTNKRKPTKKKKSKVDMYGVKIFNSTNTAKSAFDKSK